MCPLLFHFSKSSLDRNIECQYRRNRQVKGAKETDELGARKGLSIRSIREFIEHTLHCNRAELQQGFSLRGGEALDQKMKYPVRDPDHDREYKDEENVKKRLQK